jgi:hypothetical protein
VVLQQHLTYEHIDTLTTTTLMVPNASPFIALLSEVLCGWRSRDKTAEITYFLTSKMHVVHGCTFGTDDLLRQPPY